MVQHMLGGLTQVGVCVVETVKSVLGGRELSSEADVSREPGALRLGQLRASRSPPLANRTGMM